jgi:hypothetical protein
MSSKGESKISNTRFNKALEVLRKLSDVLRNNVLLMIQCSVMIGKDVYNPNINEIGEWILQYLHIELTYGDVKCLVEFVRAMQHDSTVREQGFVSLKPPHRSKWESIAAHMKQIHQQEIEMKRSNMKFLSGEQRANLGRQSSLPDINKKKVALTTDNLQYPVNTSKNKPDLGFHVLKSTSNDSYFNETECEPVITSPALISPHRRLSAGEAYLQAGLCHPMGTSVKVERFFEVFKSQSCLLPQGSLPALST